MTTARWLNRAGRFGRAAPMSEPSPSVEELEKLQQDAVGYFLRAANPDNGLIADSSREGSPCPHRSARKRNGADDARRQVGVLQAFRGNSPGPSAPHRPDSLCKVSLDRHASRLRKSCQGLVSSLAPLHLAPENRDRLTTPAVGAATLPTFGSSAIIRLPTFDRREHLAMKLLTSDNRVVREMSD